MFKHGNLGIILLICIALGSGVGYWAYLHSPRPEPRTSIAIHRNSLLPHEFAGPCLNCHRIEEVGPVSMNKGNMHLFRLSPVERRLLEAGQRVDVPTPQTRLQTPAITRRDMVIPHHFVGVCSNCHVVLDVSPSPTLMQSAMRKAYQPLLGIAATPGARIERRVSHGGALLREREVELYRNITGFIALLLFLFSCVYLVMRQLVRMNPAEYRGKFDLKGWLYAHEWLSVCFTIVSLLHWYFAGRGNNFLHVSLVSMVWLTLAGLMLHYRVVHGDLNKGVRLLHTQRVVFFTMITLLVIGHLVPGLG